MFVNEPGLTGPGHPADTAPINSPMTPDGRAWGISYFLGQQLAFAQRPFASALLPGQTFSMDLDMRTASGYLEGDDQFAVLGSSSLESGILLHAGPVGDYRVEVSAPAVPATYFTSVYP